MVPWWYLIVPSNIQKHQRRVNINVQLLFKRRISYNLFPVHRYVIRLCDDLLPPITRNTPFPHIIFDRNIHLSSSFLLPLFIYLFVFTHVHSSFSDQIKANHDYPSGSRGVCTSCHCQSYLHTRSDWFHEKCRNCCTKKTKI